MINSGRSRWRQTRKGVSSGFFYFFRFSPVESWDTTSLKPVLKPKVVELGSGEPTAQDLEQVRHSYIPAQIHSRSDLPPSVMDFASTSPVILDRSGQPIPTDTIYPFVARPSNSYADFYWTYMTLQTLENYAQDATEGRALLLGHDTTDMPIGYSYAGQVVVEDAQAALAQAAMSQLDQRAPMLSSTDPLAWLYASYYMTRGANIAKRSTDEVINSIEMRTLRDMSIQFYAEKMQCSLCGLDMWDWDCPHIPGIEYDPFGVTMRCLAAIINGRLLETSLVYKGATPDAGILQTKARMVTATERLTPTEARQVSALEARLGQRLVDPAQLQRVWSKVVPAPQAAPQAAPHTAAPGAIDAAQPGQGRRTTDTQPKKETVDMRRKLTGPARAAAAGTGGQAGASGVDAQIIADDASAQAQALADQITAAQGAIAAQQTVIDGLNAQVTAAQNQVDANGDTIDNTDLIAGLNQQIEGEQATLDSLNANLTGLQAELDGINATADATGGTSVTQPAAATGGAAGSTPPATGANSAPQRARAALGQMRAMVQNHVAPMRLQMRDLTSDQLKPVVDAAQQLVDDLNQLLTDAGATPARSAADLVIHGVLKRAAGGKEPSFAFVRSMVQEAIAGRQYIADLQSDCVAAQVRAFGGESVNENDYRQMLRSVDAAGLKRELERLDTVARQTLTSGRRVLPTGGTVDLDDQEPVTSYSAGQGGGLFTN